MTEKYYIDEFGFVVCDLDGSRFVGMKDFNSHKKSWMHRKRVEVQEEKPKIKRINIREKIFNY